MSCTSEHAEDCVWHTFTCTFSFVLYILMWNKLNLHLPLSLSVCACVCKCVCAHVCVCMHFHVSSHSASDINPTVFSGFCLSLARQIMLTASLCASSRVGIKSPFLIQSLLSTLHVKGVQYMPYWQGHIRHYMALWMRSVVRSVNVHSLAIVVEGTKAWQYLFCTILMWHIIYYKRHNTVLTQSHCHGNQVDTVTRRLL